MRPLIKVDRKDKAGVYLTVIFHLVLVIILLSCSIHTQLTKDTSFLIDFSAQEEEERNAEQARMRASVSEELDAELDALLRASRNNNAQTVRNVAVDASEHLRDDRYEHPEDIYKDARELQERLDRTREEVEKASEGPDDISISKNTKKASGNESYKGPSVISYSLDGRKAMSLPVPAYKCLGGGDVSVSIIVNRKGYVVDTRIIESVSSTDQCLRDYALRAAGRSRFTASGKAPERQAGEIVYRFIAQ
ncbi:MAG TPA: hypothetical protein IAC04_07810 [Candidatus Coprenecus stercoravium]|uniref:TonB C-terminal domain-containing protein n=1 Tax=Candidatus Coprenecus stercoravium TaxID=2840735 RepID=A0A9D2GSE6_9BACT|nr:hypothetical protein [Candidatus Coprenecus stercoravium]